jgi:hypothetical protein
LRYKPKEASDGGGTADGGSSDGADGGDGSAGGSGGTGTAAGGGNTDGEGATGGNTGGGGGTDGSGGGDVPSASNNNGSGNGAATNTAAETNAARFTVWNPQNYVPPMYAGARQYAGLTEQLEKSMKLPWLGDQFERWQFSNSAPVPKNAPLGWGRYPGADGSAQSPGTANPFNPFPNTGGPLGQVVGGPGVGGGNTGGNAGGGGGNVSENTNPEFILPSQSVTGNSTAGQASGQSSYVKETQPNGTQAWVYKPTAVANEYAGYYVPPQYVGHPLPIGAFKTLFPNSQGTDWSKVKPEGWGPNWRPTRLGG